MARTLLLALALAWLAACGGDPSRDRPDGAEAPTPDAQQQASAAEGAPAIDRRLGLSPNARVPLYESLRAERDTPPDPADGAGRGLVDSITDAAGRPVTLRAGGRARIRLTYEAGPLGIARGGALAFRVSPFWSWDPPQPLDPTGPGYTEMSVERPDLGGEFSWDGQRLILTLAKRPLAPGERVHVTYGAGPALARVDRFAERAERLWFEVDGNGDGRYRFVDASPSVDIAAGPPARLFAVLPTTARPGEEITLRLSVLDAHGSAGTDFRGDVHLDGGDALGLPPVVPFERKDRGVRTIPARAIAPGVVRVRARARLAGAGEEVTAQSNPLLIAPGAPRLRWGDLHGHSQLSDGTGTPEDYFSYARDVAGLDAIALTDHDHWGFRQLDMGPEPWQRIRALVARFDDPGRFVTLLGYEWTSVLQGHRHVLYFGDEGDVLSFLDARYQTPAQLWDALRGRPALTFAHHPAGGPIATNWRYRPDPELEPVTEIASIHGSSEAPDAPMPIYDPVAGNFVRDALDQGVRVGFIGSGDSHDGHPGASHLDSRLGGGLAAIFSEELTREGIRAALRARRVYATNGPRLYLEVSLDGAPMGSSVAARDAAAPSEVMLRVRVLAETPLERIDLVRSGEVETVELDGPLEWSLELLTAPLASGEYHYVRVVQRDGGAAWSSPIYAE